jgi:hypothetical protein
MSLGSVTKKIANCGNHRLQYVHNYNWWCVLHRKLAHDLVFHLTHAHHADVHLLRKVAILVADAEVHLHAEDPVEAMDAGAQQGGSLV